jgi:hypothetical protein
MLRLFVWRIHKPRATTQSKEKVTWDTRAKLSTTYSQIAFAERHSLGLLRRRRPPRRRGYAKPIRSSSARNRGCPRTRS